MNIAQIQSNVPRLQARQGYAGTAPEKGIATGGPMLPKTSSDFVHGLSTLCMAVKMRCPTSQPKMKSTCRMGYKRSRGRRCKTHLCFASD
ncbi:uncharacterized protein RCC_03775 [Ramularia collo-cygni]|uniref:Uncharacterized protein n=1 Tax=Ramularia collo-cygni TaxID=112498 RepID=A0A2D3UZU4_9PEZI|nr:uncharacterized protein RCC_03775 [Ramularia collo-cygni]CZT17937.1 uncharacterized protein RCC_03775 [Ramularia collo-cygni]